MHCIFYISITLEIFYSENCGFGHIYWRNPWWKTSFLVQWFKNPSIPLEASKDACEYVINISKVYIFSNLKWKNIWKVYVFFRSQITSKRCCQDIDLVFEKVIFYNNVYGHDRKMGDSFKTSYCLSHDLLIGKLHANVFDIPTLRLLHNYHKKRMQLVKIDHTFSFWEEIWFAVPQRSI